MRHLRQERENKEANRNQSQPLGKVTKCLRRDDNERYASIDIMHVWDSHSPLDFRSLSHRN